MVYPKENKCSLLNLRLPVDRDGVSHVSADSCEMLSGGNARRSFRAWQLGTRERLS